MKKLMTVLASAATALCAVGAWADFTETSTDFESSTAGQAFDSNNGMDGHWVGASDAELFISNHTDTISVSRPNYEDRVDTNEKYLAIESSVTRGLNEMSGTAFPGVAIPDNGIYLDTLVKFTAADEVFGNDALAAGDKIAIEYVAQGDDVDNPITNFVIRAGKTVEGSLVSDNYLAAVPAGFNVNDWHRLTVRVIDDVGDGQVGFVIYLDGDVNKLLAYDKNVDAGFGTLNAAAQKFYNENLHALYPSAVDSQATSGSAIASATFSGTGCIDDVVFTTTTPNFIQQGEAVSVPFVADAGVTAISVTVAGVADPIPVVDGAATLPAQTADFTVNVTVDTAGGYTFGSMTVGDAVYNTNPASVTGYAGGDITITTIRNNFNLFDANDNAITTGAPFQTLSGALAATGVATIKLAYDYVVAENEDASFVTYNIGNDVTLDLNGKTITAVDTQEDVLFTVGVGAELVVIDSVGGGAIDYDTDYGVFGGEGDTVVGATSGDFGPTIIGPLLDAEEDPFVTVVRAKLDAENNSTEQGAFAFGGVVAKGSSVSAAPVNGYWVVAPQGGSEPTEIAVPTAESNLVYDGTEQTGVAAGEGYTLTGVTAATNAGEYTATATLSEGYVWEGGSKEAQTINWSIAPKTDAAVVVTLTSEIAEYSAQLEFPTASATIGGDDVAGTPAWDPATISEPEAGATNTYTVTFTVTTANYAGSTGTATFKVYKAAGGGSDYPSYIDDITDPTAKAAYEAKYDKWATTYSVADGESSEEAFLLNCAPADVETAKANFKIPSITVDAEGNVTVGTIEGTFNGKLQLKGSTDLENWTNLDAASKDYNFFKYELTY